MRKRRKDERKEERKEGKKKERGKGRHFLGKGCYCFPTWTFPHNSFTAYTFKTPKERWEWD